MILIKKRLQYPLSLEVICRTIMIQDHQYSTLQFQINNLWINLVSPNPCTNHDISLKIIKLNKKPLLNINNKSDKLVASIKKLRKLGYKKNINEKFFNF